MRVVSECKYLVCRFLYPSCRTTDFYGASARCMWISRKHRAVCSWGRRRMRLTRYGPIKPCPGKTATDIAVAAFPGHTSLSDFGCGCHADVRFDTLFSENAVGAIAGRLPALFSFRVRRGEGRLFRSHCRFRRRVRYLNGESGSLAMWL